MSADAQRRCDCCLWPFTIPGCPSRTAPPHGAHRVIVTNGIWKPLTLGSLRDDWRSVKLSMYGRLHFMDVIEYMYTVIFVTCVYGQVD